MTTGPPTGIPSDLSHIPADLAELWRNVTWMRDTIGCSTATVYRLQSPTGETTYVKIQPSGQSLPAEHARLAWLQGRLPVPRVLAFQQTPSHDLLWMTAVPGYHAAASEAVREPAVTVRLLAEGMRRIHAVSVADCPFDKRVTVQLAEAKANIDSNRVDTDDFDEARQGRAPADLYAELLRTKPSIEDLVFTHGDYSLPNIMLDGDVVSGFIDWVHGGVADRHRDIAIAMRSIKWNLGPEWVQPFLDAYGLPDGPDRMKVEFFQLLDEFF